MSDRKIVPGMLCRHFKGNLYQIITVAKHSETLEDMVVYQALYGNYEVYVRPLSMFFETIDMEKYPNAQQRYRFVPLEKTKETVEVKRDKCMERVIPQEAYGGEKEDDENTKLEILFFSFLDATSYKEKLDLFHRMKNHVNERVLNNIAATMDLPLEGENIEKQYEWIERNLEQHCKFECNRFR